MRCTKSGGGIPASRAQYALHGCGPMQPKQIVCVKFCKNAVMAAGLSGFQLCFLVLLEVIHIEISVSLEPVLVGLDGESSDEAAAGV